MANKDFSEYGYPISKSQVLAALDSIAKEVPNFRIVEDVKSIILEGKSLDDGYGMFSAKYSLFIEKGLVTSFFSKDIDLKNPNTYALSVGCCVLGTAGESRNFLLEFDGDSVKKFESAGGSIY